MSRSLPVQPNLRHLRNEAKKLHKSLTDGDAESTARVAANLPRLSGATPATVAASDVSLQEVQHVLAKEYGHPTWESLVAAVEAITRPDPDLEPLSRPLEQWSLDEVRRVCHGISRFVKDHGDSVSVIPPGDFYRAIEAMGNHAAPSVGEFLRLAADGTEADKIAQFARQRGDTVARNLEVRRRLVLEATVAMQRGEPARLLRHRLDTIGHAENESFVESSEDGTVEQLRERLAQTPVSHMRHADLATVLVDLASIVQRQGAGALAGTVELLNEDYLREALQMVVDQIEAGQISATLEPRLQAEVESARLPFAPFGAGLAAALMGRTGSDIDAAIDKAAAVDAPAATT